jgi:hypothetical protein
LKDFSGVSNSTWKTPNRENSLNKDVRPSQAVQELIKKQKELHQIDFRDMTPSSTFRMKPNEFQLVGEDGEDLE